MNMRIGIFYGLTRKLHCTDKTILIPSFKE